MRYSQFDLKRRRALHKHIMAEEQQYGANYTVDDDDFDISSDDDDTFDAGLI